MGEKALRRHPLSLQARNALILGLALAGAIPYGWPAAASLAAGGGIQVVNLWALERNVRALLHGERRGGVLMRLSMLLRVLLLLGTVGVCLLAFDVDPVPFVVGLSTLVPAAIWHGLSRARTREGVAW